METGLGGGIASGLEEMKESDKIVSKLKQHKVFKSVAIESVAFNLSGALMAVGTLDGFIELWNPITFS